VSFSFFFPHLYSVRYSDKANYQIKEFEGPLEEEKILNKKKRYAIGVIDMRIEHSKREKINTFFRFSIFHNVIRERNSPGNSFVQFQLGANFNFDQFFKP
jgi:hypothetical protein